MFGIPFGLIVRLGIVAVTVGVLFYAKHLYDDHIRAPVVLEYEGKLKAANQRTDDAIAINATLQRSLDQMQGKVDAANKAVADLEQRGVDASKAASEAIAKAVLSARATQSKIDSLRLAAKTQTPGDREVQWAEADRILTEYASDIQKARDVLGLK